MFSIGSLILNNFGNPPLFVDLSNEYLLYHPRVFFLPLLKDLYFKS